MVCCGQQELPFVSIINKRDGHKGATVVTKKKDQATAASGGWSAVGKKKEKVFWFCGRL